eukprot:1387204-Amorphochlora_amoeboformis.AAC.1
MIPVRPRRREVQVGGLNDALHSPSRSINKYQDISGYQPNYSANIKNPRRSSGPVTFPMNVGHSVICYFSSVAFTVLLQLNENMSVDKENVLDMLQAYHYCLGDRAAATLVSLQVQPNHCPPFEVDLDDKIEHVVDETDLVVGVSVARGDQIVAESKGNRVQRSSCANDDSKVLFELGLSYHTGTGVQRSISKAMEYYRRAAAYGSTDALCHLGLIFELGDGEIAPDRLRAREYYKQAETRLMVVQAATMDTEEGSIGSESSFEKEPEKPKPRVILKEIKHLIHLGSNRENFFTYSSTFQGDLPSSIRLILHQGIG